MSVYALVPPKWLNNTVQVAEDQGGTLNGDLGENEGDLELNGRGSGCDYLKWRELQKVN